MADGEEVHDLRCEVQHLVLLPAHHCDRVLVREAGTGHPSREDREVVSAINRIHAQGWNIDLNSQKESVEFCYYTTIGSNYVYYKTVSGNFREIY